MKKWLTLSMMMLLFTIAVHGATITVTQPLAGNVTMGCPIQIAWTASGVTSNVKILLRTPGGALIGTIANNLPLSHGSYNWTVAAPAVTGESYKIHVRATDGSAEGASAVFTVKDPGAPPPPPPPPPSAVTLTLGSPNGGESWRRGTEHTISWTSTNLTGKVQLDLMIYKGETQQWMVGVIADNLPATGSFTWKAGEYQGHTAGAGQYKIRVRSMTNNDHSDASDAPFNLQTIAMTIGAAKKPLPLLLKPDLVVCGNATIYTPLNTPGTFHVYVRNIGGSPAKAPFVVQVSMKETLRVTFETDLAPGETRWVGDYSNSGSKAACLSFAAGVDPDDVIKEANEQNNRLHGHMFVGDKNPVSIPLSCSDDSLM